MIPSSFTFHSRPLKALQIGLSEALFQPSLHLSINAVDTSVPFSKTTKKGKVKVWFFFFFVKKVPFSPLFFLLHQHLLFIKIQFKVHGWGKLFLHSLFVSFFIFNLFVIYLLFFSLRKEVAWLPFAFSLLESLRQEPFCLASVASGTAFPGRWSGSCSGALLRRCQCVPCPWKWWEGGLLGLRQS